jgi:hypothetical protein
MKHIFLLSSLFAFLIFSSISGQITPGSTAAEPEGMFRRLRENRSSLEKLAINDSIKTIIESFASSDSAFRYKFSNLRFLGQITSPDNLIKLITWNLILEDGGNRYFCYIIRRSPGGQQNIVYKLSGIYNEAPLRSDTVYTDSNW